MWRVKQEAIIKLLCSVSRQLLHLLLLVCILLLEPQSNGLPEEAHMTLGEEPTYPLDLEDENTTPVETGDDDKEEIIAPNNDKTIPPPGTWAARISQVCPAMWGNNVLLITIKGVCVFFLELAYLK